MDSAVHYEKTLSSEVIFEGRVITLTNDVALLENGETAGREVVHHHGGACILPYFEDGTICMVRQFRYAMQQELWELPAGKLEKGEDPFLAAQRELEEECGLTADHYTSLGQFYPTVGYDTEIIYMWVATGLHKTQMHLDDDEFLTPDRVPLQKAYEMVMSGEIRDGKTIAGVLKLKALLDEGKLLVLSSIKTMPLSCWTNPPGAPAKRACLSGSGSNGGSRTLTSASSTVWTPASRA